MSTLVLQRNKQPERLSDPLVVKQQIGVELAFEPQAPLRLKATLFCHPEQPLSSPRAEMSVVSPH